MFQHNFSIWIGFDPREAAAYAVARKSIVDNAKGIPVRGLVLDDLRRDGIYTRQTEKKPGVDGPVLWDTISEAPMATEFAISRFLVPHLAKKGWAMFIDCDVLARTNIYKLFEKLDPKYALYCVKHNHQPTSTVKMDGQVQTTYARKNWSSVMVFNCGHPSNAKLTVDLVNTVPGRDLHRFCWLEDDEIGELGPEWNWLAGYSDDSVMPRIVHHTDGSPCMRGYENAPYADEWRAVLNGWAR
jgi:hypothetical protein